jgi:hypothetical protein
MRPSRAARELGTSFSWSRRGPVLVRAASGISGPNSHRTSYGRSSTGRASVSKTEGCRFDSCRPCRPRPAGLGMFIENSTANDARSRQAPTDGRSVGTASTHAPTCRLPTGDPGRGAIARPRRQRRRASRCGVSASTPALGAGGRGSTPCVSTLAPSSSRVERTPDTRMVGGSSPPSATHPHPRDDPRR